MDSLQNSHQDHGLSRVLSAMIEHGRELGWATIPPHVRLQRAHLPGLPHRLPQPSSEQCCRRRLFSCRSRLPSLSPFHRCHTRTVVSSFTPPTLLCLSLSFCKAFHPIYLLYLLSSALWGTYTSFTEKKVGLSLMGRRWSASELDFFLPLLQVNKYSKSSTHKP